MLWSLLTNTEGPPVTPHHKTHSCFRNSYVNQNVALQISFLLVPQASEKSHNNQKDGVAVSCFSLFPLTRCVYAYYPVTLPTVSIPPVWGFGETEE